jgi:hypothetical protein
MLLSFERDLKVGSCGDTSGQADLMLGGLLHFWHGFNLALPGAQDDGPTKSHSLACVNRALGRNVGVSSFGGRCLDRCSGDTSSLVAKWDGQSAHD